MDQPEGSGAGPWAGPAARLITAGFRAGSLISARVWSGFRSAGWFSPVFKPSGEDVRLRWSQRGGGCRARRTRGAGCLASGTGEAGLGLALRICASWRFRAFVFLGAAFCARCRAPPSWSGRPEEAAPERPVRCGCRSQAARTRSWGTFWDGPLGAGPSLSPLPRRIGEAGCPTTMIVILKCKQSTANKLAFAPSLLFI